MNGMRKYKVVCKDQETAQKMKSYLDKNRIKYEEKDKKNTIKLHAHYDEAIKNLLLPFLGNYDLYSFDKHNNEWESIDSKPFTLEEIER